MFNVSDAQIEFFVRRLIQDRKIIEEKIDDNTIKKQYPKYLQLALPLEFH